MHVCPHALFAKQVFYTEPAPRAILEVIKTNNLLQWGKNYLQGEKNFPVEENMNIQN
jgi:hypothetical protein